MSRKSTDKDAETYWSSQHVRYPRFLFSLRVLELLQTLIVAGLLSSALGSVFNLVSASLGRDSIYVGEKKLTASTTRQSVALVAGAGVVSSTMIATHWMETHIHSFHLGNRLPRTFPPHHDDRVMQQSRPAHALQVSPCFRLRPGHGRSLGHALDRLFYPCYILSGSNIRQ